MKLKFVIAIFAAAGLYGTQVHANLTVLRAQAQKGVPEAQLKLGELYQYGVGQQDHLVYALSWYERAAPHLARARVLATETARGLTPEERLRAQALAQPLLGPP